MMRLRHTLPALASVGRQVDVTAAATLHQLTDAIATLAEDPGVDALLIAVTALAHLPAPAVQAAVEKISQHNPGTTMILCLPDPACGSGIRVPVVDDPGRAVTALARAGAWGERRAGAVTAVTDAVPPTAARRLIEAVLSERTQGWLTPSDTAALLREYQVPLAPSVGAVDPESAAEASCSLRFPVVLKGWGQQLVHKSASGAVMRGLRNPDEVAVAARAVLERCGDRVQGLLLQPEISGDRELIVGGLRHQRWGGLIMVCRGGVGTDVDPDRQWALAPVPTSETMDMLRGLRCAPALVDGTDPASPLGALTTGLIVSVSTLVAGLPEVAELDLNPVILTAAGPVVADARIRVEAPTPAPPVGARAMG